MMKTFLTTLILSLGFATFSQAALITNGDFQSCDLSGWQTDTDGFGDPGATADFSVLNNAGQCAAQLRVDDGSSATAFFANTLFQELDLSAAAGDILTLNFDWDFAGTDGDSLLGDYFSVFLSNTSGDPFGADGTLGYLIDPTSEYAAGQFSMTLDASLYNQTGWTLNFVLQDALSPTQDILFSTLNIDNASISATSTAVDAPATLSLSLLALLFFARRKFIV
jgi:hypothetical protein